MSAHGDETVPVGVDAWLHRLATSAFWYTILVCYLAVLSFLSLNPWVRPESTASAFSPDKLHHALAYGGLAIIVFCCLNRLRYGYLRTPYAWMASMMLSAFIGILLELAQSQFTINRTGTVEDAVANSVGAVLGFFAFYAVKYLYARSIMPNRRCPPSTTTI